MLVQNLVNNHACALGYSKDQTQQAGISPADKIQRLKTFRDKVFCAIFDQLFALRIAGMVSLTTLAQTGKRFYRNKLHLEKRSQESADEDPQSLLALLTDGKQPEAATGLGSLMPFGASEGDPDWDASKRSLLQQMNRYYSASQALILPDSEEESQVQMQKCESFTRDVFTKVIKPLILEVLCPKIERIVLAYISQLKLVQEVTLLNLQKLFTVIYQRILDEVFKKDPIKVQKHEAYLAMDNLSTDSLDPEADLDVNDEDEYYNPQNEPHPWIVEQLVERLRKSNSLTHAQAESNVEV